MVARIKGKVTEGMLRKAATRVQSSHPHLRARIWLAEDQTPWFILQGVGENPVQLVVRESRDHWIKVVQEASRVPFKFEEQPPVRFILVQSPEVSDLVILCHHIICDGLSLAYLLRDMMMQLGELDREVETMLAPLPITLENVPAHVSVNALAKFFIKRINKNWDGERVVFDQVDYQELTKAYWKRFTHQVMIMELSEDQTTSLVERRRGEGVTVNSALSAAIVGVQSMFPGSKPLQPSLTTAASLRDRLPYPPGEGMGFFAGAVRLHFNYDASNGFWENARRLHRKLKPLFNNKELFKDLLPWCYLQPEILD